MIGATTSKTLDLTLLNSGDTVYSTSTIKVEIGLKIDPEIEYIPMGVYNIDEIEKTDYTIKITAFDNMVKFETPYFSNLGDTPTLLQVVNELASITGVQFTGNLPSYKVKKLEGFTCREVLGYVASICGGNAIITRDGKFTIVTPEDIEYNIDPNHYFDYKREDTKYKIGKISCKAGEEVLSKGSLGTDSMELQFENPWVTNSILQDIYNKINGFEYLGYSMKWQGDLSLDLGDIVTITDKKGVTRKHPILSQKFIYTGGLTSEIGAKGETKNKNSFSSSGNTSQKVERIVTELLLINDALINKATIQDLEAVSIKTQTLETKTAQIEDAIIGVAYVEDLAVINASISNLQANKANISDLAVINGSIDSLKTNKADVIELNAVTGRIGNLESDVANIGTILSKDVFSELATVGKIVAGSQIIAEGAIGSAQISDLNASKLSAGIADLSKVTIQGTNGRLKIANNKLQVFDGTSDLFERVVLGDVNGDGSVYGLRIRGADGTTILFDENGQTKEGFTDGYNKLDDNSLNPRKLDIAQVVTRINEGTTTIQGSKISVDGGTLDVKFSTLKNTVNSYGESISTHSSQISALDNAIKLKVDTQTYNTKMTTLDNSISVINTNLSNATSDISILQGQIELKVEQTDIERAINEIEVGGRNLVLNSTFNNGFTNWRTVHSPYSVIPAESDKPNSKIAKVSASGLSSDQRISAFSNRFNAKVNDEFTFSVDFKVTNFDSYDIKKPFVVEFYDSNGERIQYKDVYLTYTGYSQLENNKWYRLSYTTKVTNPNVVSGGIRLCLFRNGEVFYREVKVEKGNKATDWTPAPEDVQSQLDRHNTKISTAESSITQLTNSIALKVDTSEVYKKNEVDNLIKTGDLYVKGTGKNRPDSTIIRLNGNDIYNGKNRGLHLVTLKRSDLTVVDNMTYDVYISEDARNNLANKLNNLDDSVIVILASCDALRTNQALQDAIARCGGTGTFFGGSFLRVPYALVGIPNIGKGAGIEVFTSTDANAPYAEINTKIINGVPQGINTTTRELMTRMSSAELKITDSAIVSTVRNSTAYKNDLSGKVGTTEIISKINQSAESITIQANKIGLLGETNIPDLTADKIKGGTLTLGGGTLGKNGEQIVYDVDGNAIIRIDKDGLVAYSGTINIVELKEVVDPNNSVTTLYNQSTIKSEEFYTQYIKEITPGSTQDRTARLHAVEGLILKSRGSSYGFNDYNLKLMFDHILYDISEYEYHKFSIGGIPKFEIKDTGIEVYGDAVVNQNITARGISIKVGTENHEIWHNGNCFASPQTTGFQELESGVIIQWGTVNNINGAHGIQVSFPKTFKTVFSVVATPVDTDLSNNNTNAWVTGLNKYNFYLRTSRNSNVRWIAVGIVE